MELIYVVYQELHLVHLIMRMVLVYLPPVVQEQFSKLMERILVVPVAVRPIAPLIMCKTEAVRQWLVVPVHHIVITIQRMENASNKGVAVALKNHTVIYTMKIPETVWNKRVVPTPLRKMNTDGMCAKYRWKNKALFLSHSVN